MKEDYEFKVLFDVYEEYIDSDGHPNYKLISKDCKRKWYVFDLANITDIRQAISKKGMTYKNRCEVYNRLENKWVVVEAKYDQLIKDLKIEQRKKVNGFYGSK